MAAGAVRCAVKPTCGCSDTYCTTTGPGLAVSVTSTTQDEVTCVFATDTSHWPLSNAPEPANASNIRGATPALPTSIAGRWALVVPSCPYNADTAGKCALVMLSSSTSSPRARTRS